MNIAGDYNLSFLKRNVYPGRGMVVGLDDLAKNFYQIYWIMGRSENSRNRIFSCDKEGRVFTEPADPSKVKDPKLIIYNAMKEDRAHGFYVMSNGDQTDGVLSGVRDGCSFQQSLKGRQYEPDAPNFTQRITALCSLKSSRHSRIEISILRKSSSGKSCDRCFYSYEELQPEEGRCVTTYLGDGDPLPAFIGEPLTMPLRGDIETIAKTFWDVLDKANRISLTVKRIPIQGGMESEIKIINKFSKITQ